ncbi:MAG: O-acetylhomoserine aminocarboxypropyltransferase/cysteine synthase, partial [Epsilonproteobacteria bacterium]|nr:O-acetylhomoserine aminocarboxypropyltransferase/cysteine synthase [Campylobacterota bacterium]
ARVGNPTNAKLESVVTKIENGFGAVATSSGMGAISMVLSAILSAGDEVLCIGGFFGGTYTLVGETLKRFGVTNSFCEVDDFEHIEKRLQAGTKIVLMESVGNPSLRLPNIKKIADLCKKYETLLVIDNTVTPLLVQPLLLGADIVVHSSTKNMSGHSASLGGIAVFREVNAQNDKLLNIKYKDLHGIIEKVKKGSLIAICKKRALRDIGMSANAFGSFLTLLGLETLSLRVQRVNQSVTTIVKALNDKFPKNITVNHPSLEKNKDFEIYNQLFKDGCGPVFTIDCTTQDRAFKFIDKLKLATLTANIGDNRTLALHMKSTIYRDFADIDREFLGITDGLIRVSVGLENPRDIIKDFLEASHV